MLENSNLIDGSNAKRVNELIQEYQDITAKAKDLETSKKNCLKELFEITEVGVNETNKFVFNVINNKGAERIALSKVKEQAPELLKKIEGLGLISKGEDYKTVRGIKLKGERS